MKIVFRTWAEAMDALVVIKVEPEGPLYLLYEGSYKAAPYEDSTHPFSWTKGTGRYVISTERTGEQVLIIHDKYKGTV